MRSDQDVLCWLLARCRPCRCEAQQRDSGLETPHPQASANWRLRCKLARRLGVVFDSVRPDASVLPEALRALIRRTLGLCVSASCQRWWAGEVRCPSAARARPSSASRMEHKWKCKAGETTRFPVVPHTSGLSLVRRQGLFALAAA